MGRKKKLLTKVCGMITNTLKIAYGKNAVIAKMLWHNSHPLEVKKTYYAYEVSSQSTRPSEISSAPCDNSR